MKIKKGFAKREIAGSVVVVPVGKVSRDFNGMITLNGSASFIWDCFCNDITKEDAVRMLTQEYDVDAETAKRDIDAFIEKLKSNNLIEE